MMRVVSPFVPGLVLCSLLGSACGNGATAADPAAGGSEAVASALRLAGLSDGQRAHLRAAAGLSAAEAAELCLLATEGDYDTYATPGVPAPTAPVKVVMRVRNVWGPDAPALSLHLSTDGWATTRDLRGATRAPTRDLDGVPDVAVVFPLGAVGATGRADWATHLGGDVWLNNHGQNYHLSAPKAADLTYVGDVAASVSGLPIAATEDSAPAGQLLQVSAQSYPPALNHSLTLLYSLDGLASVHEVPMALYAVGAGPFGGNVQRTATVDLSGLAAGTQVTYWVRGGDGTHTLYASNGGANYHVRVVPAPDLGWVGAGSYSFTKCHMGPGGTCQAGWFWFPGLSDPLDLTPDAFQVYAAAPAPGVEIYAAGLSDLHPDGSAAGLLRVQVMSPFFSGAAAGAWTTHDLRYRETSGNNYRYTWDVRQYIVGGMPAIGVTDPPNGDYPFKFRVSSDGGATWHWLGTAAWPDEGGDRTFSWAILPR